MKFLCVVLVLIGATVFHYRLFIVGKWLGVQLCKNFSLRIAFDVRAGGWRRHIEFWEMGGLISHKILNTTKSAANIAYIP